ncbi:MAG: hypothetical protein AAGC58_12575 [Asticcacaulis sp.]
MSKRRVIVKVISASVLGGLLLATNSALASSAMDRESADELRKLPPRAKFEMVQGTERMLTNLGKRPSKILYLEVTPVGEKYITCGIHRFAGKNTYFAMDGRDMVGTFTLDTNKDGYRRVGCGGENAAVLWEP